MNTHIAPGSIVVGVDGSAHADRAVYWAAEQAHFERRPLTVVAVSGSRLNDPDSEPTERARTTAESAAKLARIYRPEIEVDHVGLPGDPREVLPRLATSDHLLVLGSRGRGAVGSKLLGSVSAAVSRHAAGPVIVCRPGSELAVKNGVVVGADGSPESRPVLEFAFQQASVRDEPLTVLHTTWDVFAALDGPGIIDDSEAVQDDARRMLAESVAGFAEKFPEVRVTRRVARGYADESLTADSGRWSLIVVGRHPTGSLVRRISGIVATSVLERSRSTVAVVPEPAPV
jgi:nucleotide-binding universal stress UspA family protein